MEEMQHVRLEHLSIMHQAAHFFTGRSQSVTCSCTHNYIECFGSCQMMTYRTYTTKTLDEYRSFPIWSSLHKPFKSSEFNNVKSRLRNLIILIEMNSNFTVTFNSCYWFYSYFFCHDFTSLIEFDNFVR